MYINHDRFSTVEQSIEFNSMPISYLNCLTNHGALHSLEASGEFKAFYF
jgi:hypothetical protein